MAEDDVATIEAVPAMVSSAVDDEVDDILAELDEFDKVESVLYYPLSCGLPNALLCMLRSVLQH
jgi:hypothetical protein